MGIRIVHRKWHYRFELAGQEYTGNTGSDATASDPARAQRNRERALQAEAKARATVEHGKGDALRIRPRGFSEAAADFLGWAEIEHRDHPQTARRLQTSFASLLEFFCAVQVSGVTAGRIEDYKTWRRTCPVCKGVSPDECEACEGSGQGVRDVTLRHDLHALSGFFRYAQKQHWALANPLRQVEIPSDRQATRFTRIEPDQERAYFREALKQQHIDLYDVGKLMRLQGARPSEVMASRHVDVDLEAGTWSIPQSKTPAGRRVLHLLPDTRSIFARRGSNGSPWLFPSPKRPGEHLVKVQKAHLEVLEAIGCSWVLYDWRHNFATECAARGMPLPQLSYILGHRDLKTIMRYVHVDQTHAAEAMRTWGPDQTGAAARLEAIQ